MLKKILCIFLTLAVMLVAFSGCGKQVETVEVAKADSIENFAAYKAEIIALLDKEKIEYDFSDFSAGNEEDSLGTDPYIYIMKITLKGEPGGVVNIGLTNKDQIESFTVSLEGAKKEKIGDCDLNIRDYSFVRKIFNLVSEIEVSAFTCNRLMRSTRKGIEEEYELNTTAFYKKDDKFFARDKTKTWYLQYTIYYNTTASPVVFEETLSYRGNLALR
jgi:hypothetical protein